MKSNRLRVIIPLAVLAVFCAGYALTMGTGTLSGFGWKDISLLCPLGALESLLATKTLVPRVVVSIVVMIVLGVVLGRAFCGWVCPVPVVSKLRTMTKKRGEGDEVANTSALSAAELESLKGCQGGCEGCAEVRQKIDSRHVILAGTLLSAAVFGFPVFCLVCPIGLTFATVLVVMLLFQGDVTWSVLIIPALLLVEVVFFRRWCSRICPLSALMSLLSKPSKTLRPAIDDAKCLETSHGAACGRCAMGCSEGINPRHPELGAAWSECTKCRACIDACPAQAISLPFLPKQGAKLPGGEETVPAEPIAEKR